jgi:uncharacterized protein (TIGR02145 family)
MKIRLILTGILLFIISYLLNAQDRGTFIDPRDNIEYEWIKVGDQVWMAENLAYLPSVNEVLNAQFDSECYYIYGYDGTTLEEATTHPMYRKYGVLYNWVAANNSCPEGWHLPDDKEWILLEQQLGLSEDESAMRGWRGSGKTGKKLKSAEGWYTNTGTNEAGLDILPGGCRGYRGFESEGYCAYFWTASPAGGDNGWRRGFCGDDTGTNRGEERRYFGISVRCIQNK